MTQGAFLQGSQHAPEVPSALPGHCRHGTAGLTNEAVMILIYIYIHTHIYIMDIIIRWLTSWWELASTIIRHGLVPAWSSIAIQGTMAFFWVLQAPGGFKDYKANGKSFGARGPRRWGAMNVRMGSGSEVRTNWSTNCSLVLVFSHLCLG